MSVLFLSHRIPFPPDRGDKIRSHHILKALAGMGPVHVGCFADTLPDKIHEPALAKHSKSYRLVWRGKPLWLAGLQALFQRKPVSLTAFHDKALAEWVEARLAKGDIRTVYVFSGQMGQYLPQDWSGHVVMDLVDVDSAKFAALAKSSGMLSRWIYWREARLLAAEEVRLAKRANFTVLVSDEEAGLLQATLHACAHSQDEMRTESNRTASFETCATQSEALERDAKVQVMGNGIDTAHFSPDFVPDCLHQARLDDVAKGPHFVFTGQMDYAPNEAAVTRMAQDILPLIRTHFGDAAFHVIGRCPTAAVRRLHGQGGCYVWGEVRDTRPFLAQADIVIAPLTVARGVQNKVLEAMAMAKPVLLSPGAATGIPGTDGRHFVIAESNHDFATCAIAMLNSASLCRSLGENARAFATQHRSWQAMLAPLDQLLEPAFVYPSQGTDLADVPTGYGTSPSVLPLGCDAFGEGVEVRK